MGSFTDSLIKNSQSDIYPMHMPGHKRQMTDGKEDVLSAIRAIDITEIDGFDDLHEAEGIIAELFLRGSRIFKSEKCRLLVNGSSCGVLAGISAAAKPGSSLIMARNSHKSAYNGVMLNALKPIYVYPKEIEGCDISLGIAPEDIEAAFLENEAVCGVFITSPTYEGIISDVRAIADIAHRHGVPLIVDEAHGAHLSLYPPFSDKYNMRSAVCCGADIVIQSIHKTLPAFTQSALIHYQTEYIDEKRLCKYLSIYQSSSPSYILMAGADRCFDILEEQGDVLFARYEERLSSFYERAKNLKLLHILTSEELRDKPAVKGFDIGKILICTRGAGVTGEFIKERLLKDYHIQLEMSLEYYALAMTSIMDSSEGLDRLIIALSELDDRLSKGLLKEAPANNDREPLNELKAGSISEEYIYAYPPGIPIVVPGEVIDESVISRLRELWNNKVKLYFHE